MEWISIKDKLPLEKSDKRRIICVNVYNGVEVFPLRYEKAYLRGKVVYRWREAWGRLLIGHHYQNRRGERRDGDG